MQTSPVDLIIIIIALTEHCVKHSTMLNAIYVLYHLLSQQPHVGGCYYPHFTVEETET